MRKNAKKYVTLTCENCGTAFVRAAKEYTRCQKKGYSTTCSRSCGITISNKKFPRKINEAFKNYPRNTIPHRQPDEMSPFRYFINRTKRKGKIHYGNPNISLEYLKCLWESQNGKCPYTGYAMILPRSVSGFIKLSLFQASLDRIDSSKPYVEGNVEFVCLAVNYAKNGFTKDKMIDFFSKMPIHENSESVSESDLSNISS